jgi:hypothetical protein
MATLRVLNPVAKSAKKSVQGADRVGDLAGKRVGLFWNMKIGGNIALEHLEKVLGERYPTATFGQYQGNNGSMVRRVTKDAADDIASKCDVIIGTTGDCGSCTTWLIHDMVEFEKRGVATVAICAEGFEADAMFSADTFGLPGLRFVTAESTFTSHSPDDIRSMTDEIVDDIITSLTREPDEKSEAGANAGHGVVFFPERELEFAASDDLKSLEEMNERFLEYGYGDGFPLYPATADRVDAMLAGTHRAREEVVAILQPGYGIATIEAIAVNAVMAGCKPDQLPVLITAIECIADPQINLRGKAMSTGSAAPMIIVNGPIRDEIGLNSGMCALGPGAPSRVNTAIGRALRLCMMNLGHTYAQLSDMDTMGTPTKYSMCIAENQERSPWEPYHVSRGFDAAVNTVTVHFNYGYTELHDFESHRPEDLIEVFSRAALNLAACTTGYWLAGRRSDATNGTEEMDHDMILVCPEHAEIFEKAGWSRQDIQRAMFKRSRLPFRDFMRTKEAESFNTTHPDLKWLWDSPDTLLPVVEKESCFDVAVLGAVAGRSQLYWGAGGPVTKAIQGR